MFEENTKVCQCTKMLSEWFNKASKRIGEVLQGPWLKCATFVPFATRCEFYCVYLVNSTRFEDVK